MKAPKKHLETDKAELAVGTIMRQLREIQSLEKVNLEVNTMRVHVHQALSADRERLISQVHQIDSWLVLLGFSQPAQMKKENQP